MSIYYVLEKTPPKHKGGATLVRVQTGPIRKDNGRTNEFINQLVIRCPERLNLKDIEPGKPAEFVFHPQGTINRKGEKPRYNTELVATSVRPVADWLLWKPEALYPVVEYDPSLEPTEEAEDE